MAEFPFTWQLERSHYCHRKKINYTISVLKIDAEWSLECLWSGCGPEILEIRRNTTGEEILVSGTFKLLSGLVWSTPECLLQRKFVQLIEEGCETTQIELEYFRDECNRTSDFCMVGTLTIPAYFSQKEYIEGAQIQSLLNLSTNFECLLDPQVAYPSDFKFKCGTESFPVHKTILSARSPVFASMFTIEMKENIDNEVDISDIRPNALKTMLTYIYAGKIGELSYETAGELLFAADKYQLQDLKRLCCRFLKNCMSTENALEILFLGYLHDEELKVFTMDFICKTCKRIEVLEKTEQWKTLRQKSPHLTIDLLIHLLKSSEKKSIGK